MDAPADPPIDSSVTAQASALFTDLYQLTMVQAYLAEGMEGEATFSLAVRTLPKRRNYLLACGQEQVLAYLEALRFTDEDINYLQSLNTFSSQVLDWLGEFRFTGDVFAVAEGSPVFANEPILEIVAPLPQAQLIETFVMNQIHLQTLVASKAARVVTAAQGRDVVEFGARRIHGAQTAVQAARACFIAGACSTSNVLAGKTFGVPVVGTMAHSFVQAFDSEVEAFRAFTRIFPETTLLVDTYDTLKGVRRVVELRQELGDAFKVQAIRIDSGDLAALAVSARGILDDAGLTEVSIFASGGLDEDAITAVLATGAPVDAFGVGTRMGVSEDAPSLEIAYKLADFAGHGRLKLSPGKTVLPGQKQVFRASENGRFVGDTIARVDESLGGEPLLTRVMRGGRRLAPAQSLAELQAFAAEQIARLPDGIRAITPGQPAYPVAVSASLSAYQRRVEDLVTG